LSVLGWVLIVSELTKLVKLRPLLAIESMRAFSTVAPISIGPVVIRGALAFTSTAR
jgi:hypothetical protein